MTGDATSHLPRLVAYTREDKAAKGLRSLRAPRAVSEPPLHFTALEMIQEERALLLTAPPGGGRTTLARQIARLLSGERAALADHGAPVRNELGDDAPEEWRLGPTLPAVVTARPGLRLEDALTEAGDGFAAALRAGDAGSITLLILDDAERLGDGWRDFAAEIAGALAAHPRLRLLLLGEARIAGAWTLPQGLARHALLPLPRAQRERALAAFGPTREDDATLTPAAAHPGIFALARQVGAIGAQATPEAIVDAWLHVAPPEARAAARMPAWLAALLDAADLAKAADPLTAVSRFAADPEAAAPMIASLLARWRGDPARSVALMGALLDLPGDGARRAALCVAEDAADDPRLRARLGAVLLETVDAGALRPLERIAAGRALARLGDPRDLEAMIDIPGGVFAMGCASNPNSSPPHEVAVAGFRIGAHPVTNARYAAFVAATGRRWASEFGHAAERANMPATDLTWHDARAFCAWLTPLWRREGRIAAYESLRLPTEPEWERAARGDQPHRATGLVHPWGLDWDDDRVNGETTGANDICAVGLFPRGRSPYGCFDMAGQVWEWCLTLWGEDMARPSFAYPWRDDGREARDAPDAVRRVLRGGFFSSGPAKANVAYRGSLEAGGFWRGNGFRIVAAPSDPVR
jgi:iron(II)-dependent oxidoreductase